MSSAFPDEVFVYYLCICITPVATALARSLQGQLAEE